MARNRYVVLLLSLSILRALHRLPKLVQSQADEVEPVEPETGSYTEEFIRHRLGSGVNITKLLLEYSLICPLRETCGVDLKEDVRYSGVHLPAFSGCTSCTCAPGCVGSDSCCPGSHFGYVEHECVDVSVHPEEDTTSYKLVAQCLNNSTETADVIRKCETKISPCTAHASGISYKNKLCALCNMEISCEVWKLKVECAELEEEKLLAIDTFREIRNVLDGNGCRVLFKPSKNTVNLNTCLPMVRQRKLVSECNVTGLWKDEDADIEWACKHFLIPFQNFKNVFCYICNPSLATVQHISLVDTCVHSAIEMACKKRAVSKRLFPFKNIYCYACNHLDDNRKIGAATISETFPYENMYSLMTISMIFSGPDSVSDLETFLLGLLDAFEEIYQPLLPVSSKTFNTNWNISEILERFVDVCGSGALCAETNDVRYLNPVCGKCSCSDACAETGSCCLDVVLNKLPYSCVNSWQLSEFRNTFIAASFDTEREGVETDTSDSPYMVIDKCLENDAPEELRRNCSDWNLGSNSLYNIPVGALDSDIVYRNIYCYKCNSNSKSDLRLNFEIYCDTYVESRLILNMHGLQEMFKSHCNKLSFKHVNTRACNKEYNTTKVSLMDGTKFVRRKLHLSMFEEEKVETLFLQKDKYEIPVKLVFEKCNKTGHWLQYDKTTKDLCESKSADLLTLLEYRFEDRVYKNFACFLCNSDAISSGENGTTEVSRCLANDSTEWFQYSKSLDVLCESAKQQPRWFPYKNLYCAQCNLPPLQKVFVEVIIVPIVVVSNYKYLFSISPSDFLQLKRVREPEDIPQCLDGTYDFILKRCRKLYCMEGSLLSNDTCKYFMESAFYHDYSLGFVVMVTDGETDRIGRTEGPVIVNLVDMCQDITRQITSLFRPDTEYFVSQESCIADQECIDNVRLNGSQINDSQTGQYIGIANNASINVRVKFTILFTEDIMLIRTILVQALSYTYYVESIRGDLLSLEANYFQKSSHVLIPCGYYKTGFDSSAASSIQKLSFGVDRYIICPMIRFNLSDSSRNMGTLTMHIRSINVTFTVSEYKITEDGNVVVCADDLKKKFKNDSGSGLQRSQPHPLEAAVNLTTLVCTVLSVVCLSLTFITYCLFPSLRTTPGKINMVLCFFLPIAQSLLQFGLNNSPNNTICITIGVGIHFFWLGSFSVMNVSSFHMFRVFCFNAASHPTGRKTKFLKYLIYVFVIPSVLVSVSLSVNLIRSNGVDFGYGKFLCFISHYNIFLSTFIVPACLIFLSNFIFFSVTFHKIRSTPRVESTANKRDFYLYIKLCTLVGLTWPLLIVDNILGISWLSFLVSGLNSLQGVFIFYSYIVNKRVATLFMSLLFRSGADTTQETNHTRPRPAYLQNSNVSQ